VRFATVTGDLLNVALESEGGGCLTIFRFLSVLGLAKAAAHKAVSVMSTMILRCALEAWVELEIANILECK